MTAATLVVIPMRDEAATIEAVIEGVRRHAVDVLVVDDGSNDAGANLARTAGAEVLALAPNRGKGFAIRQGLRVAAERGYERVATMDADLEHDPVDLPALLAALDAGADVVLGERRVFRSGARTFWNRFATFFIGRIVPGIADTTCGFRAFRTAAVAAIDVAVDGFEYEQLFLLEAARARLRFAFVPVGGRPTRRTGVTRADLVRANDAFDRWVLDNVRTLTLSTGTKLFLRLAARVGLGIGRVLRRIG